MKFSLAFIASMIPLFHRVSLALPSSDMVGIRRAVLGESIFERQSTTTPDGTCGHQNSGNGKGYKCTTGTYRCCSQWGWCGDSDGHCGAGCQQAFGFCNNSPTTPNQPPTSTSSSNSNPQETGRPKLGNVPYAAQIYSCTTPGTVALTFDDGPWIYTSELLDILDKYGAKATFFVNGQNWGGPITDESNGLASIIRRADSAGHQIGSHTWSHPNLDSLSIADIRNQMSQLESALFNIIGKIPTYMRPPYYACGSTCVQVMGEMGYHIIISNIETSDYANDSPDLIHVSEDIFNSAVSSVPAGAGSWLVAAHDVHGTKPLQSVNVWEIPKKTGIELVTSLAL